MGSNQSKSRNKDGEASTITSYSEKHTSSSSTAPLADTASQFASNTPRISHHRSWNNRRSVVSGSYTITSIPESPDTYRARSINSTTSPQSTLRNTSNTYSVYIHETDGHSNVSRPPPAPRIRHLNELIDPVELPAHVYVRSPSGNILARDQYLVHPDRPLSIRERQEEIREKVRTASRLAMATPSIPEEQESLKERKTSSWCNCFRGS